MFRALVLTLLLCPAAGRAQDLTLRLTCDLNGLAAPMILAVDYVQSFDPLIGRDGGIRELFPAGTEIQTAGQIQGQGVTYVFTGRNGFADVTELPSNTRFRIRWVLDGPNDGVWMIVNPFGPGPTRHFCAFQGTM
ncbi:hypothetical protein P1J78_05180 [Psychromarinibacter sp. C21-152]|uniref:Uncharacterized protein n=1 Tax=Psychromarinibacter sediminicola TaxID=3033385 RepID=A0AAE3NQA9_9RHOB|nr:hypothetical protein [Psychromarinibacter sediminicola]MDF0600117.1 hypothetical protein [Psychromarinibacter sediminicola]